MKRMLLASLLCVLFIGLAAVPAHSLTIPLGDQVVTNSDVYQGNIATSSTSFENMQGMQVSFTTTGNATLLIFWNASIYQTVPYGWAMTRAVVDSDTNQVGSAQGGAFNSAPGIVDSIGGNAAYSVGPGDHTVKIQWKVSTGGSAVCNSGDYPDAYGRALTVLVIRR